MVSSDPAAAAAELANTAADLERKAQQFEDLRTRMTALSLTEESAKGRVRVTVDANGVPTDITITDRAVGTAPAVLSAEIMSCLATVQARLRDRVTDMVHESVGGDSAGEMLIGQYTDRFPDPDPDPDQPADVFPPDSSAPSPSSPPPVSAPPPPQASGSAGRGSWRDTVVTPEEPDEDDLYFRNKNWLE